MTLAAREPSNGDFEGVSDHMLGLALGALTHANGHANYSSYSNLYWSELSVLQAAHAAELLIKARIAQEHPLLIFEQLPRPTVGSGRLQLRELIGDARTYQYAELPDRLWAVTGIRLPNLDLYRRFGRLRNAIQHFAPPEDGDFGYATAEFIYSVIDPFIHECWGLYAIDYSEDWSEYEYDLSALVRRGIKFLVSPEAAESFAHVSQHDWEKAGPEYREEMERRALRAAIRPRQP